MYTDYVTTDYVTRVCQWIMSTDYVNGLCHSGLERSGAKISCAIVFLAPKNPQEKVLGSIPNVLDIGLEIGFL